MMDCEVIRDLLPLYADGQTSPVTNRRIEEHTARCPACKGLMDRMCAPMEPEPVDEEEACLRAIKKQRRKTILRTVLACLLVVVVCVVGWWIYMETHFVGEYDKTVSTDKDKILSEIPMLELTEEELALKDTIFSIPPVAEMYEKTESPMECYEVDIEAAAPYLTAVVPEEAEYIDIAVTGTRVGIDYCYENRRMMIDYIDGDRDGKVDMIQKFIAAYKPNERWDSNPPIASYSVDYVVALERAWYEKTVSKHIWFGFLNMP